MPISNDGVSSLGIMLSKITHASAWIPLLLLGAAFSTDEAGYFSRALMLVHLPLLVVGNAIGQVFFQKASERHADGEHLGPLVDEVFPRLIWISILPAAVIAVIGPQLVSVVLGPKWLEAGLYAQMLSPRLALATVAVPLLHLICVYERLGKGLAFQSLLAVGQVAALVVGGWVIADPRWSIGLLSATGTGVYLLIVAYLLHVSRASLGKALAALACYTICAAPTVAVAAVTRWALNWPAWAIVLATGIASLSYVLAVLRFDPWARAAVAKMLIGLRRD